MTPLPGPRPSRADHHVRRPLTDFPSNGLLRKSSSGKSLKYREKKRRRRHGPTSHRLLRPDAILDVVNQGSQTKSQGIPRRRSPSPLKPGQDMIGFVHEQARRALGGLPERLRKLRGLQGARQRKTPKAGLRSPVQSPSEPPIMRISHGPPSAGCAAFTVRGKTTKPARTKLAALPKKRGRSVCSRRRPPSAPPPSTASKRCPISRNRNDRRAKVSFLRRSPQGRRIWQSRSASPVQSLQREPRSRFRKAGVDTYPDPPVSRPPQRTELMGSLTDQEPVQPHHIFLVVGAMTVPAPIKLRQGLSPPASTLETAILTKFDARPTPVRPRPLRQAKSPAPPSSSRRGRKASMPSKEFHGREHRRRILGMGDVVSPRKSPDSVLSDDAEAMQKKMAKGEIGPWTTPRKLKTSAAWAPEAAMGIINGRGPDDGRTVHLEDPQLDRSKHDLPMKQTRRRHPSVWNNLPPQAPRRRQRHQH